jgi:hypothetical protein
MTNVTYLIGAGASAGKRDREGTILEGLPCVNEISKSLRSIVKLIDQTPIPVEIEWKESAIGLNNKEDWESAREKLLKSFKYLYFQCEQHATIDTYAKKLVLKKRKEELKYIEKLLTLFFIYIQMQNQIDSRYDTFLANILDPNLHFPSHIRVLSWNYDSQFELAYSGYDEINDLIIGHKNSICDKDYEIIKINGTATFAEQKRIIELRKDIKQKLQKIKNDIDGSPYMREQETWLLEFVYLFQLYVLKDNSTHLSFAFDDNYASEKITRCIDNIIKRTDVLVIIGYTFPFFNRQIDRQILQCIKPNTKIYIQDLNPERIKQSLMAVLPDFPEEQIFLRKDVDQFFLPPEL